MRREDVVDHGHAELGADSRVEGAGELWVLSVKHAEAFEEVLLQAHDGRVLQVEVDEYEHDA